MQIPTKVCVLILFTIVFKCSHQNPTKYRKWSGNFTGRCTTQRKVDTNIGCLSICKAKGCQVSTYLSDTRACHVYNNVTLHANGSRQEKWITYVKDTVLEEQLQPKEVPTEEQLNATEVSTCILFRYCMT